VCGQETQKAKNNKSVCGQENQKAKNNKSVCGQENQKAKNRIAMAFYVSSRRTLVLV
jgi:hypothetical protein